ncbi:MAG: cytochrome bd-I oxidase subunit CydX [Xanthobacter sp.]
MPHGLPHRAIDHSEGDGNMWYFAWVLGVAAALSLGIINVMWFEFQNEFDAEDGSSPAP